jgi:hypothetical protein
MQRERSCEHGQQRQQPTRPLGVEVADPGERRGDHQLVERELALDVARGRATPVDARVQRIEAVDQEVAGDRLRVALAPRVADAVRHDEPRGERPDQQHGDEPAATVAHADRIGGRERGSSEYRGRGFCGHGDSGADRQRARSAEPSRTSPRVIPRLA